MSYPSPGMQRAVSEGCRGSLGSNATVTKCAFPSSSALPLSQGKHRGSWWETQSRGGYSHPKCDGFRGDSWIKLTNDQQFKACATINGEQIERAWEGAIFSVLGEAVAGSRDALGRAKLAATFLVGA